MSNRSLFIKRSRDTKKNNNKFLIKSISVITLSFSIFKKNNFKLTEKHHNIINKTSKSRQNNMGFDCENGNFTCDDVHIDAKVHIDSESSSSQFECLRIEITFGP